MVRPVLYIEPIFEDIQLPKFETTHAACMDIRANILGRNIKWFGANSVPVTTQLRLDEPQFIVGPGDRAMIPTGVKMCTDKGWQIKMHPRSGLSTKKGLVLANQEGIIDADYREEVMIPVYNMSSVNITIEHGMRIAQIEVCEAPRPITKIETLPKTTSNRDGGFNSTGSS